MLPAGPLGTVARATPVRCSIPANAPARLMLVNAHGIQFSQLVGAPDWLKSETWSLDARAEGDPTRDDLMLMFQSLLEERFHLKVHHDSRERSVYVLKVARNVPKLPAPKGGTCMTPVPGQPEPAAPPCGGVRISMSPLGVPWKVEVTQCPSLLARSPSL